MTTDRKRFSPALAPFVRERRAVPRFRGSTMARMETHLGASLVDILDLSRNGGCFALRDGLVPEVGELVRLAPIGMASADGTIVWTRRDKFGIVLDRPIGDPELWLDPVAHGHDFFAAIIRLQRDRGR